MSESPVNPGDMLAGRYRVDRLLGMGNMGVVVAATHVALQQRVAVKLMLPGKAAGEDQHARFLREARASVRLKTQHAARVFDVGTLDSGAPYMVMELLEGRDLAAVLAARGKLPIAEAVDYVLQACEAVAEAHAAGIIHRDLKPANLFLSRGSDGKPCIKVLDFGISKHTGEAVKLTHGEEILGSPLYMSPEQLRSSMTVDVRADVWALGVLLYELVAGKTPFHAEGIMQLCTRVNFEPPTPLSTYGIDAPPGFEAVLFQCLEKNRARRMPSVAALATAIAPWGTAPLAAIYAERVAAVLGEQVVPARPTDVLPLEPVASAPATAVAATGNALSRSSTVVSPRRPGVGVMAAVVVGSALLAGGAMWMLDAHTPPGPAPAGSVSVSAAAVASSARPAIEDPPAVTPTASASAVSAPTAGPTAVPVGSARVGRAAAPISKGAPPPRAPVTKDPAPARPASPDGDPYGGRK